MILVNFLIKNESDKDWIINKYKPVIKVYEKIGGTSVEIDIKFENFWKKMAEY